MEITRFDIPQTVRDVIDIAIYENVIDVYDVYGWAAKHQGDFDGFVMEIIEAADSDTHCGKKYVETYQKVVDAANDFYRTWLEVKR